MGSSSGGNNRSTCNSHLIFCALFFLSVQIASCDGYAGDSCDWSGSGLSGFGEAGSSPPQQEPGVHPLYLRCRQGRIRWSYPSGGLRLVLRLQGTGKEFRACIRPGQQFEGARIYMEGHRRLHLLYEPRDDHHNEVVNEGSASRRMRCFVSVRGQAALYVEAKPLPTGQSFHLKKTVAEFAYDLQPLGKDARQDDMEECRPCTDEETIQYYCSSDYVIEGTVHSLTDDIEQDRSRLVVRVSRVHRDSPIQKVTASSHESDDSHIRTATFYRPLKCETKSGSGQFMFISRILLDDPYVTCAPRLDHWKALRRKAIVEDSSPCLLD